MAKTKPTMGPEAPTRSEEHTSELQSRLHLVCRLLLEKKKHLETLLAVLRHLDDPLADRLLPSLGSLEFEVHLAVYVSLRYHADCLDSGPSLRKVQLVE